DALLAQARGLAGEVAQVVELRASDATAAHDFHALDARRVQGEGPLDAHAVGDAADGEGGPRPFAALADDDALERLQPLLLALDDFHVHAHGVTGGEAVAVLLELPCFYEPNGIHDVVPFPSLLGRVAPFEPFHQLALLGAERRALEQLRPRPPRAVQRLRPPPPRNARVVPGEQH